MLRRKGKVYICLKNQRKLPEYTKTERKPQIVKKTEWNGALNAKLTSFDFYPKDNSEQLKVWQKEIIHSAQATLIHPDYHQSL